MTAEIGILNREGVALAADSAVTVGGHGLEKVYNSANKLFSLSKYHPIGVMIYGGANFMGIPWETIIKTFRKQLGTTKKDKLEDYCKLFIDFLKNDKRLNNSENEKILVLSDFADFYKEILNRVEEKINKSLENDIKPDEKQVDTWIRETALLYIRLFSRKYKEIDDFKDKQSEFIEKYSEDILEIISNLMAFETSSETNKALLDLAFLRISRDLFTSSSTGLVIAGYGEDELFPSLYEYKIDGFILDVLKIKLNNKTVISSFKSKNTVTAAIVPFAQKEMVLSFLTGIDPRLDGNIYKTLDQILKVYPDIIKDKIVPTLNNEQINLIKDLGSELLNQFKNEIHKHKIKSFINPVIDIVKILPKEELAAMAEALVNLTSFKRKITYETETVGGPIDVAVITKGDGLIWIKRKHYFKPEYNYHFFQNYLRRGDDDV